MEEKQHGQVISGKFDNNFSSLIGDLDLSQTVKLAGAQMHFQPLRFWAIMLGGVLLAEITDTVWLNYFETSSFYLETLIEASIMMVLIFPLVYIFSLKPLIHFTEKSQQAEQQVREMALFPTLNPDATLMVKSSGQIVKANPGATEMGFRVGAKLTDVMPDFGTLDLPAIISTKSIRRVQQEAGPDGTVLLWTVRGVPELELAFLYSKDITENLRASAAIRLLSSIVEQTDDTVVVTNYEGVIEYVNPSFEKLTGFSREEALGKKPNVLKSSIHDDQFYKNLWSTILSGEAFLGEIANRKKNGELFYEVKTITPLRDAHGNTTHFVATGKNITERKLAEEKLRKAYNELDLRVQERTAELSVVNVELKNEINERKVVQTQLAEAVARLESHMDNSPLAVIEFDPQLRVVRWSNEAERMFGWSAAEVFGRAIDELHWVHEEDVEAVAEISADMLSGKRPRNFGVNRNYRKDGEIIYCEWYNSALYDAQGQLISIMSRVLNITERKQAEDELSKTRDLLEIANRELLHSLEREQWLARTDGLTNLYNSRYFFELAAREINAALRYERSLAILMFDVDHFKQINDTAGHTVGDNVLARVANISTAHLRAVDIFARYGGDEFIILFPETDAQQAFQIAERIRESVAGLCFETEKGKFAVSLSIGVAEILHGESSGECLKWIIQRADKAVYAAKAKGRNCTVVYSAENDTRMAKKKQSLSAKR